MQRYLLMGFYAVLTQTSHVLITYRSHLHVLITYCSHRRIVRAERDANLVLGLRVLQAGDRWTDRTCPEVLRGAAARPERADEGWTVCRLDDDARLNLQRRTVLRVCDNNVTTSGKHKFCAICNVLFLMRAPCTTYIRPHASSRNSVGPHDTASAWTGPPAVSMLTRYARPMMTFSPRNERDRGSSSSSTSNATVFTGTPDLEVGAGGMTM